MEGEKGRGGGWEKSDVLCVPALRESERSVNRDKRLHVCLQLAHTHIHNTLHTVMRMDARTHTHIHTHTQICLHSSRSP